MEVVGVGAAASRQEAWTDKEGCQKQAMNDTRNGAASARDLGFVLERFVCTCDTTELFTA